MSKKEENNQEEIQEQKNEKKQNAQSKSEEPKNTEQNKQQKNENKQKLESQDKKKENEENQNVNQENEKNTENKKVESNTKEQEKQNNIENGEQLKTGFFKKVWNSIVKIETYPAMAAQGFKKAIIYMIKIIVILAIVLSLGVIYQMNETINKGKDYLQNNFPEFSYQDGILTVEGEQPIIVSEDNDIIGKTIVDTNQNQEQEKINGYISAIEENGNGFIILSDRLIVKDESVSGTITYVYKEALDQMKITQFNKQTVLDYINSGSIINLYISLFATFFIYSFTMYFFTTLINVLMLSVVGYITTWIARIKMRYIAIFNMAVYSITLSTILNIIYLAINIFIPFTMEYFQVMYITVSAIYLIAAIFILKTEFIKKQAELMKIVEAQEIIKKQMQQKEEEDKNKKEPKEDEKEKKKEEKKEKKDNKGQEPEGSNA